MSFSLPPERAMYPQLYLAALIILPLSVFFELCRVLLSMLKATTDWLRYCGLLALAMHVAANVESPLLDQEVSTEGELQDGARHFMAKTVKESEVDLKFTSMLTSGETKSSLMADNVRQDMSKAQESFKKAVKDIGGRDLLPKPGDVIEDIITDVVESIFEGLEEIAMEVIEYAVNETEQAIVRTIDYGTDKIIDAIDHTIDNGGNAITEILYLTFNLFLILNLF